LVFRKKWVTGFWIGFFHVLAVASALSMEWIRTFVSRIDPAAIAQGARIPDEVRTFYAHTANLSENGLYRWGSEMLLELSQPRAVLWAAAFTVIVVRLNKHGPPQVQAVLSVAAAVVGVLGALVYLQMAFGTPYAWPSVVLATGAVWFSAR
jgi:hypothetical protein